MKAYLFAALCLALAQACTSYTMEDVNAGRQAVIDQADPLFCDGSVCIDGSVCKSGNCVGGNVNTSTFGTCGGGGSGSGSVGGVSTGLVIGIIIAVLLVVGGGVAFFIWQRRKKQLEAHLNSSAPIMH